MYDLYNEKVISKIKNHLIKRKETLAVAESVTAGLLQSAFASAENASLFFQGGITTYNLGQKSRHLLIEPIHALSCNCVSGRVSEQMATNVCQLFNSNWGIGITGYASPTPESDHKLFCFYTIVYDHKKVLEKKIVDTTRKDPFEVQIKYIDMLLEAFVNYLAK